MGAQAERAWNTGWAPDQRADGLGSFTANTSPSSSRTIFFSSGDGTTGSGNSVYSLDRRVRVVQAASTAYGRVSSASFGGGLTTVTLSNFSTSISTGLTTGTITSAAVGAVIKDTDRNPIASSGDLVYGSSNGALTRLTIGTTGSMLVASTGIPTWLTPGSSGSILEISGAVPTWLAPGTTGALLSITGGVPAWVSLLGTASAQLAADTASTSTSVPKDLVSISLTTGTWWASAAVQASLSGQFYMAATLWDGSTKLASGEWNSPAAGAGDDSVIALQALIPVGVAGTWKVSAIASGATTGNVAKAATRDGTFGNATYISAWKVSAST